MSQKKPKTVLCVTVGADDKLEILIDPAHFGNLLDWGIVLATAIRTLASSVEDMRKKHPGAIKEFTRDRFCSDLMSVVSAELERPETGLNVRTIGGRPA